MPANATTNAVTVPADGSRSANVAPVSRMDSPPATITTSWHRSARCPPSIVHSSVRDRPNPGTDKPCSGAV